MMLEETPWLRQAQTESQARRNVGILFDDNRLNDETGRGSAEAGRAATRRRRLAVVPRRAAQRLHHALHHHRLRPAAAPGREDRHRPGRQVARPARRLDRPASTRRSSSTATQGRQPSRLHDRLLPLRPQLLPEGQADRRRSTRRRSITSSARPGSTGCNWPAASRRRHLAVALKRFGDQETPHGHHEVDQGAVGQQRGAGHVLARHGAVVVVVPRPDRDPGDDDRGLRRSHERPAGGRGLQGLAAQAEADAGLEDHQGHRRRGLRPAAARRRTCWPPTRWSR